jgi:hypothetical protein
MIPHRSGIPTPGARRNPTQFQRVKDAAQKFDQSRTLDREVILALARDGDKEALAFVKKELKVSSWVHNGKKLI